jgi:hypothetical protein
VRACSHRGPADGQTTHCTRSESANMYAHAREEGGADPIDGMEGAAKLLALEISTCVAADRATRGGVDAR